MHSLSTLTPNGYAITQFRSLLSSGPMQLNPSMPCLKGTIWRDGSRLLRSNYSERRRTQTSRAVNHASSQLSTLSLEEYNEADSKVIHAQSQLSTLDVSQEWNNIEADSKPKVVQPVKRIEDYVSGIKEQLSTMGGARITISPYDTARVALIKDVNGQDRPQFLSCLGWIAKNQLPDGSWGDLDFFIPTDRLLNTLACVIALKTWNLFPDLSEKGISFINDNVHQLESAEIEYVNCGFEIVFPALLQKAKDLGIDELPYDAPVVKQIYKDRDRKMKKIPKDLLHTVPTTLLFSLEGFEGFEDFLDWEKIFALQKEDGSISTSPAATSFAYMETKDENCLRFITNLVETFNGAVPHSYPIDLLARLWAIDRLQRLGIARYIEPEITELLEYVYGYWDHEKGIFSSQNTGLTDVDDTAMGFRLLRQHGFKVDADVFEFFRVGDGFSCFAGQIIESESPIFALYRASQFLYPGEKILEETKEFATKFLQDSLSRSPLLDKWVISKNLPGEIQYGLDMPWYTSLPRVEARAYLEHYSGNHETWNGKSWFRLAEVGSDDYLALAILDFNRCQLQHQIEWDFVQEWYENSNVEEFGISKNDLLNAFFLASASIFETERSKERLAWAKSQIISKMITNFINNGSIPWDQKVKLSTGFLNSTSDSNKGAQGHTYILLNAIVQLQEWFEEKGFDENTRHQLKEAWNAWLMKLYRGAHYSQESAALHATIINICGGRVSNEDILSHTEYTILSQLANKIGRGLSSEAVPQDKIKEAEKDMQALVQLVLEESEGGLDRNIKQTFLTVAKTYFYQARVSAEKIEADISEILFEPVVI